jgi:hypothetical protein
MIHYRSIFTKNTNEFKEIRFKNSQEKNSNFYMRVTKMMKKLSLISLLFQTLNDNYYLRCLEFISKL